jgi:hypothetical protein
MDLSFVDQTRYQKYCFQFKAFKSQTRIKI